MLVGDGVADGDAEDEAVGLADAVGLALVVAVAVGDGATIVVALATLSAEMLPTADSDWLPFGSRQVTVSVPGLVTAATSVVLVDWVEVMSGTSPAMSMVVGGATSLPSNFRLHLAVSSSTTSLLVIVTVAVTSAGALVRGIVTIVVAVDPIVSTLPLATKAAPCPAGPAGPAGPRGPVWPRSCFTTEGEICDRLVMTYFVAPIAVPVTAMTATETAAMVSDLRATDTSD